MTKPVFGVLARAPGTSRGREKSTSSSISLCSNVCTQRCTLKQAMKAANSPQQTHPFAAVEIVPFFSAAFFAWGDRGGRELLSELLNHSPRLRAREQPLSSFFMCPLIHARTAIRDINPGSNQSSPDYIHVDHKTVKWDCKYGNWQLTLTVKSEFGLYINIHICFPDVKFVNKWLLWNNNK